MMNLSESYILFDFVLGLITGNVFLRFLDVAFFSGPIDPNYKT